MAARKAKRPALRYLLSADPSLRKLSMKKLAERGNAKKTPKRATRPKTSAARAIDSARWPWTASGRAMALAGIGVFAAATLFAAGHIATGTDAPAADMPSEPRYTAEAPPTAAPTRETATTLVAPRTTPSPRSTPEAAPPKRATTSAKPVPAPAVASSTFQPEPPGSVTIAGCLVKHKDGFALKDASGAAVTKGRTWRTGFFKKSSPRVGVVPASGATRLSEYVDRRVSATGILADGQLRASSIRRIASSCD